MSYIQSKSADAGVATSTTLAFTSNVTGGSTIGVGARIGATGRTVTFSDNKSNTYTNSTALGDATNTELNVARAENVAAGATTVQVAISGAGATIRWGIWEGGQAAASFDKEAGATGGSSTSIDSGATATTTQATETLVGFLSNSDDVTITTMTAGTSYTLREVVNVSGADKFGLEDRDVSATGTYNATATLGNANHWAARILTLKQVVAGTATFAAYYQQHYRASVVS